jgi:hypothetical protein
MADKLLFVLDYFKAYPTFDQLGAKFDLARSKAHDRQLTPEQKADNCAINQVRVAIEHAIAGLKRYNILVHRFRNRRTAFHGDVIALCADLWNFALIYSFIKEQL